MLSRIFLNINNEARICLCTINVEFGGNLVYTLLWFDPQQSYWQTTPLPLAVMTPLPLALRVSTIPLCHATDSAVGVAGEWQWVWQGCGSGCGRGVAVGVAVGVSEEWQYRVA